MPANHRQEAANRTRLAHELKHDGYRLQIHVRDGRVRLFTMNGADWSKRYPRIVEESAPIKGNAVMEAEVADGKRVGRICRDIVNGGWDDFRQSLTILISVEYERIGSTSRLSRRHCAPVVHQ